MANEGRTGVVIPVPAADELLSTVTGQYPEAARDGVPAHVSVLYPFLPAEEVDQRVVAGLSEVFAEQPALPVRFTECHRDGGFVFLRPDPLDGLVDLTDRTRRRWPHLVPYDGVYGDVEPHLTVSMRTTEETAARIQRETAGWLPLSTELDQAWLVALDGQWVVRHRFRFTVGDRGSPCPGA